MSEARVVAHVSSDDFLVFGIVGGRAGRRTERAGHVGHAHDGFDSPVGERKDDLIQAREVIDEYARGIPRHHLIVIITEEPVDAELPDANFHKLVVKDRHPFVVGKDALSAAGDVEDFRRIDATDVSGVVCGDESLLCREGLAASQQAGENECGAIHVVVFSNSGMNKERCQGRVSVAR